MHLANGRRLELGSLHKLGTVFLGSKSRPEIALCDTVGVFLWAREAAMQKWK